MKYRLIQRNDGRFEYEVGYKDTSSSNPNNILWGKINFIVFDSEDVARKKLLELIEFTKKSELKRVVEEFEI